MNYAIALAAVRQKLGPAYADTIQQTLTLEHTRFRLMCDAIDARYTGAPIPREAHLLGSTEHCVKLLCLVRTSPKP